MIREGQQHIEVLNLNIAVFKSTWTPTVYKSSFINKSKIRKPTELSILLKCIHELSGMKILYFIIGGKLGFPSETQQN